MNFTHYDLGQLAGGEVIEVSLEGTAANIQLMNSLNFRPTAAGSGISISAGMQHDRPFDCVCRARVIGISRSTWAGIEALFAQAYACYSAKVFR